MILDYCESKIRKELSLEGYNIDIGYLVESDIVFDSDQNLTLTFIVPDKPF